MQQVHLFWNGVASLVQFCYLAEIRKPALVHMYVTARREKIVMHAEDLYYMDICHATQMEDQLLIMLATFAHSCGLS